MYSFWCVVVVFKVLSDLGFEDRILVVIVSVSGSAFLLYLIIHFVKYLKFVCVCN